MSEKTVVLLASGGLDSTTLAFWLAEKKIDFIPLFLDYGQHCAEKEFETLCSVLPRGYRLRIKKLDISDVYRGSSSRLIKEADLWSETVDYTELYLPYRSLLILSTACAFAQSKGIEDVYSGFINSNHAQEIDCSAEFFEKLAALFTDFGGVQIRMPFRNLTKYEVAIEGVRLKAPVAQTFSCQVSAQIPCGACPNCVDRLEALKKITLEGAHL